MKLPCIDCITLAVCKGIYLHNIEGTESDYDNLKRRTLQLKLHEKCSLIYSFVYLTDQQPYNYMIVQIRRLRELHEFMIRDPNGE